MPEYQLHCFAQSGNSYRAALMLNLIGADWEPVWVDFFKAGVQRSPEFRSEINEMGELPVLVHGKKTLTQSGVILTYLANRTGKFKPQGEDEEDARNDVGDGGEISVHVPPAPLTSASSCTWRACAG